MWSVGLNQVRLKIDSDRKDTLFFRDVQEKALFGVIFLFREDYARSKMSAGAQLLVNRFRKRVNLFRNAVNFFRRQS